MAQSSDSQTGGATSGVCHFDNAMKFSAWHSRVSFTEGLLFALLPDILIFMDIVVKYVSSAFKHKITEANIRHAILNWIYDDIFEDDPNKHLLIGFDSNANLLEILYNVVDEQNLKVFHAMKCRDELLLLINK